MGVTRVYKQRAKYLIKSKKLNAVIYHKDTLDADKLENDWMARIVMEIADFYSKLNHESDLASKTLVLFAREKDQVFNDEVYDHYTEGLWLIHGMTGKAIKYT